LINWSNKVTIIETTTNSKGTDKVYATGCINLRLGGKQSVTEVVVDLRNEVLDPPNRIPECELRTDA
jgi:hypothetical protein